MYKRQNGDRRSMSTTTISRTFYVDGVATDPTSATITITYSGGTVVTDATMTAGATGVVFYSFTDPSEGETYNFDITYTYDGTDYVISGTEVQSADNITTGTMTAAGIKEAIWRRIQPHNILITNINEEILNALTDITGRQNVDFLLGVESYSVAAGQISLSVPAGYKRIIQLNITDTGPLSRISYDLYKMRVENSECTGEPREFAENGNLIYLWPTPDVTYTATLQYAYTHARILTSIVLQDSLREAVYNKVISLLFKGQLSQVEGAMQRAIEHDNIYEKELAIQAMRVKDSTIRWVKYNN